MLNQQTLAASGHALCAKFNVSPTQLDLMASAYFRKVLLIRSVSFNIHVTSERFKHGWEE